MADKSSAASIDRNAAVIYQAIQQRDSFAPGTLRKYLKTLLDTAYQTPKPDAFMIDGKMVGLGDIKAQLEQFNSWLPENQQVSITIQSLFDPSTLIALDNSIVDVAGFMPTPPDANIPTNLKELVKEAEAAKEAQLALEKNRDEALSAMDRQIKAGIAFYRQLNVVKVASAKQLEAFILDSSYLKNLADIERQLGGRDALKRFVEERVGQLVEKTITPAAMRQLNKLIAENPTLAASYFKRLIEGQIKSDDFFRTAYYTEHPEKRDAALKETEKQASKVFQEARADAQAIEQERQVLADSGVQPEDVAGVAYVHRPVTLEAQRAVRIALDVRASRVVLKHQLEHIVGHRITSASELNRYINALFARSGNYNALEHYLVRKFGAKSQDVSFLYRTITKLSSFKPEDLLTAAKLRPDLLPHTVVDALANPSFNSSIAIDVAQQAGVPPEHAALYAAGLNEKTLDTHLAQEKITPSHPNFKFFSDFRASLPKIHAFLAPQPATPGVPGTPPQAPGTAKFQAFSDANAFRTRVSQTLRFLRVDQVASAIGQSAPIQTIASPFRAAGSAIGRGFTNARNWVGAQVTGAATNVGKRLVTWGTEQAVKKGVMGFAGKAALWAGAQLIGKVATEAIPVVGQAVGAVQAVGESTVGFVGSTLGFLAGRKSLGEWGTNAFKSAGTMIGAAIGGLVGAGIGLLGLGIGAIPGAFIGVAIGALVGGMLSGGLAALAKKPEEVIKSLLGLLLVGGFGLGALLGWAATHILPLLGTFVGFGVGALFGPLAPITIPLFGYAGWKAGSWLQGGGLNTTWARLQALPGGLARLGLRLFNGAKTLLSGAGQFGLNLFSNGLILARNLIGSLGNAIWTFGGGVLGGITGWMVGGPLGALAGFGTGALAGNWLAGGGLTNFLGGVGTSLGNAVTSAGSFLGSLTTPAVFASTITTTTVVSLAAVGVGGVMTVFFVFPTLMSALFVPSSGSTGGATGTVGNVTESCANTNNSFVSQIDPAWKDTVPPAGAPLPPGFANVSCRIGPSGCGSASMTMLLKSFGATNTDVVGVWNEQHLGGGYEYYPSNGSCATAYSTGLTVLSNHGLQYTSLGASDYGIPLRWDEAEQVITSPNCGLILAGGQLITNSGSNGHILVIKKITRDINNNVMSITTMDPASINGDGLEHPIGSTTPGNYNPTLLWAVTP